MDEQIKAMKEQMMTLQGLMSKSDENNQGALQGQMTTLFSQLQNMMKVQEKVKEEKQSLSSIPTYNSTSPTSPSRRVSKHEITEEERAKHEEAMLNFKKRRQEEKKRKMDYLRKRERILQQKLARNDEEHQRIMERKKYLEERKKAERRAYALKEQERRRRMSMASSRTPNSPKKEHLETSKSEENNGIMNKSPRRVPLYKRMEAEWAKKEQEKKDRQSKLLEERKKSVLAPTQFHDDKTYLKAKAERQPVIIPKNEEFKKKKKNLYKGRSRAFIQEELRRKQAEEAEQRRKREELLKRKRDYAKQVRKQYVPHVDPNKVRQREENIHKMNQKYQIEQRKRKGEELLAQENNAPRVSTYNRKYIQEKKKIRKMKIKERKTKENNKNKNTSSRWEKMKNKIIKTKKQRGAPNYENKGIINKFTHHLGCLYQVFWLGTFLIYQVSISPIRLISTKTYRKLEGYGANWAYMMHVGGNMMTGGQKFKYMVSGDIPSEQDKNVLLLSNHVAVIDWIINAKFAGLFWSVDKLRFLMKKEHLYLPLIGWAAFLRDMIFLDRKSPETAKQSIKEKINSLKETDTPTWCLIYPEGTFIAPNSAVLPKLQEKAKKNNIKVGTYCLPPKAGGIDKLIGGKNQDLFDCIYDVTIALPKPYSVKLGKYPVPPGMAAIMKFMHQEPPLTIHYHIKRRNIFKYDTFEELTAQLNEAYEEKESMLKRFEETGQLTNETPKERKIANPTFTLIATILSFVGILYGAYKLAQYLPIVVGGLFVALEAAIWIIIIYENKEATATIPLAKPEETPTAPTIGKRST
mmetsp:Transcript_13319/g.20064  ORF Transcript_13319/g.20064 Transcript_13319/m.20064 type:complete len:805 (+) Transcript_13319:199-2613(+)